MGNEKMPQNSDYLTSKQEAELDRLVDTGLFSYDDAKRRLGLPVDDPKEIAELISTIDSSVEVDVEYEEYEEDEELSLYRRRGWTAKAERREQKIVNIRGAALARKTLEEALAKKSGK